MACSRLLAAGRRASPIVAHGLSASLAPSALADKLGLERGQRCIVLSDPQSRRATSAVVTLLRKASFSPIVNELRETWPSSTAVGVAASAAKRMGCSFVVGVGAGETINVAKAIAGAMTNTELIASSVRGETRVLKDASLPAVLLPTLPSIDSGLLESRWIQRDGQPVSLVPTASSRSMCVVDSVYAGIDNTPGPAGEVPLGAVAAHTAAATLLANAVDALLGLHHAAGAGRRSRGGASTAAAAALSAADQQFAVTGAAAVLATSVAALAAIRQHGVDAFKLPSASSPHPSDWWQELQAAGVLLGQVSTLRGGLGLCDALGRSIASKYHIGYDAAVAATAAHALDWTADAVSEAAADEEDDDTSDDDEDDDDGGESDGASGKLSVDVGPGATAQLTSLAVQQLALPAACGTRHAELQLLQHVDAALAAAAAGDAYKPPAAAGAPQFRFILSLQAAATAAASVDPDVPVPSAKRFGFTSADAQIIADAAELHPSSLLHAAKAPRYVLAELLKGLMA